MKAEIAYWVAAPPPPEVQRSLERLARAPGARRVAVLPDVHLAADVCIGCALGTAGVLYPQAVGGDIGCGVAALRFRGEAAAVDDAAARWLLSGLARLVPIQRHRVREAPRLPPDLPPLSAAPLRRWLAREGRLQLGTLGRGNHFLELQTDEQGALWALVHSGSRGLGPAIRDHHLAAARPAGGGLRALDADSPGGRAYLVDHAAALAFAAASRARMLTAVAALVGARLGYEPEEESLVDCHHNHVREELIDGEALLVHRKGAMPAREGERGVIPGSMGSATFHVVGRGEPGSICSSSHGAGRQLSRSEARRRVRPADLLRQVEGVHLDRGRAAALVEEAPEVYKDIDQVMRAQRALVRVTRRLRPVLNYRG